jgi:glycosyltransferase involved in cell wall biosynthesis
MSQARHRLGLPLDAHVVLFFGYVRRYKGLELLLEALERARPNGRPVLVVVAGRPLYDISSSIARAARLRLAVDWRLNYVPRGDISLYFSAADMVAMPYVTTSDSGALELAAAFRKPVVITAVGGLVEAFERYGYGAIVPAGDVDALAQALVRRYESRLGDQAVNSWDSTAARTRDLYSMLLHRTSSGESTN